MAKATPTTADAVTLERDPAGVHRILILGGGYVGLYTALRLQRRLKKQLRAGTVQVTVLEPRGYMTYQPFMPEASAGSLSPRHVVVPLRRVLGRSDVRNAEVVSIDKSAQTARVRPISGPEYDLHYDTLVIALGSVARTLPIPGLLEHGVGFKSIEESIYLRNQILNCLEIAESTEDPDVRQRALTFVFVGGGYAGIEAVAELEDLARDVVRYYQRISIEDLKFVMVEAMDRVLPEVGPEMGEYTVQQLRARGIDMRLNTRLESAVDGIVKLSDGTQMATDTLVWTAGVKPNPIMAQFGLPMTERGHLDCTTTLQVAEHPNYWGAGDACSVPDLANPGQFCSPSAQHAVRQALHLGDNIARVINGSQPTNYRHKHVGSVASLGLHKGVAQVYGIKLKGWPAWLMHRGYHLSRVPTWNRKARVLSDWWLATFFRRDIVSLGSLTRPFQEFTVAAGGGAKDAAKRHSA